MAFPLSTFKTAILLILKILNAFELPVPISMAPVVNALDSSKSGRDNSLGNMFRDKIAEKQEYTLTFPAKLSNT